MSMVKFEIERAGKTTSYDIEATGFLLPVAIGYKQLCEMRDRGPKPTKDLIDDIKAYEIILTAADPEARAKEYIEKKAELRKANAPLSEMSVRYVVRKLGWM